MPYLYLEKKKKKKKKKKKNISYFFAFVHSFAEVSKILKSWLSVESLYMRIVIVVFLRKKLKICLWTFPMPFPIIFKGSDWSFVCLFFFCFFFFLFFVVFFFFFFFFFFF